MGAYFITVTASKLLYNLNCNEAFIYAVHECEV